MEIIDLLKEAKNASKHSYSPYSNFKVGAALLTKDGRIFHGTNIENASYPLGICAERCCLFSAYACGVKKDDIVSFVIYSPASHLVMPCGACRQVMSELLDVKTPIYVCYGKDLKYKLVTMEELLPYAFSEDDLNV